MVLDREGTLNKALPAQVSHQTHKTWGNSSSHKYSRNNWYNLFINSWI